MHRHPLRLATVASLLALAAGGAWAQDRACILDAEGALPADCRSDDAGRTYGGALAPNVETRAAARGDLGFSIRIGSATPAVVEGQATGSWGEDLDGVGRTLDALGITVRSLGLGNATPRLNVVETGLRDEVAPGASVAFQAASTYPAWITRAEIVVRDEQTRRTIARLPIAPNGATTWTAPQQAARLSYTLEAFDAQGRMDATLPRPLRVTSQPQPGALGPVSIDALLDADRTASRRIPVAGGAIVVEGDMPTGGVAVTVLGERITPDQEGRFLVERILPPGSHGVTVEALGWKGQDQIQERVHVPTSETFGTGMIDLTVGDGFSFGRIAGYVESVRADGTRITARIDTAERDLDELFDDLLAKDPRRTLGGLDAAEPFLTYGDGSTRTDLAPSSGRLFLKVEKNGNLAQWGDLDTAPLLRGLARETRSLYGAQGVLRSADTTARGDARWRATGYAATAEEGTQRDVFRASGASSYFLSRRDLVKGSASVAIEYRDRVSGQVLQSRALAEGSDYRINTLQGVITFERPPEAFAPGGSIAGRPGGDVEVYVVTSYSFIPLTPGDGAVAGGRLEGWVSDTLRVGVEGRLDQSTTPDTRVFAADILYAPTERTSVLFEAARSRGPGQGETISNSGGLITTPIAPVGGAREADAWRLTATADLADLGLGEGQADLFLADEERGFAAPDGVVTADRQRGRLSVVQGPSEGLQLRFGGAFERIAGGLDETEAWIGFSTPVGPTTTVAAEIRHQERQDPTGTARQLGSRTDVAVRATMEPHERLSWWVYGQATIDVSGGRSRDDRIGAGIQSTGRGGITVLADASYGTLGWGAELGLSATDATGSRKLSYRLDPERAGREGIVGDDGGVWTLDSQRALSDTLRATAQATWDGFGTSPDAVARYGLAWTPNAKTSYEAGFIAGETKDALGGDVRKQGLSLGMRRTDADGWSYGLRGEWIRDRSDDPTDPDANLDTYALVGSFEAKVSQDWHMLGSLDALWSDSTVTGVGTGRYVEAKVGYAYRPTDSDRTIALATYTFLEDRPVGGQVNIDGTPGGDGQRSHILNMAWSQRFDRDWTLGVKYGARHRTLFPAGGGASSTSWSQLGVIRADYHLDHQWDVSGEVRAMVHQGGTWERGALLTVSRAVGENLRLGAGYAWGGVSDDLRSLEKGKEGAFLTLTASF